MTQVMRRLGPGFGLFMPLAFFLSLTLGCAPGLRRPVIPPDEDRWQAVSAILQKNYERLQTLRGWGTLSVQAPDLSYSTSARIVLNKPDSIFIKIEAAFGIDVGWLFSDRKSFILYSPLQNSYYSGAGDSLYLSDFIPFDLGYDKLIQTIAGMELALDIEKGVLKREGDQLILIGHRENRQHIYWIDPGKGVVTKAQTWENRERLILQQEYSRFVTIQNVTLPQTIKLTRPRERESLTLFYERLNVNDRLSEKDFRHKLPQNAVKRTS